MRLRDLTLVLAAAALFGLAGCADPFGDDDAEEEITISVDAETGEEVVDDELQGGSAIPTDQAPPGAEDDFPEPVGAQTPYQAPPPPPPPRAHVDADVAVPEPPPAKPSAAKRYRPRADPARGGPAMELVRVYPPLAKHVAKKKHKKIIRVRVKRRRAVLERIAVTPLR